MDGKKVPIDRVYGIANNLPTHITDLRLNLDPVRQEAAKQGLSLDQFNIQDIIQKIPCVTCQTQILTVGAQRCS